MIDYEKLNKCFANVIDEENLAIQRIIKSPKMAKLVLVIASKAERGVKTLDTYQLAETFSVSYQTMNNWLNYLLGMGLFTRRRMKNHYNRIYLKPKEEHNQKLLEQALEVFQNE